MTVTSEAARGRLRSDHQLRLVNPAEEGTAAADLPPGVYGFTGSPGLAAPLFRERRYRNFEIHHRRDGSVAVVGFVSRPDAERLARVTDSIQVTLHPDIKEEATEIVAIAYTRIAQHRQYSVLNQPALRLSVGPELEPA